MYLDVSAAGAEIQCIPVYFDVSECICSMSRDTMYFNVFQCIFLYPENTLEYERIRTDTFRYDDTGASRNTFEIHRNTS